MAISIFTSIITKNSSMSLLISILVWLTFTQLIYNASSAIGAMVLEIYSETRIKVITVIRMLTPDQHYQTFSKNILNAKFSIEPFSMFIRYSAFKPIPLYDSLSPFMAKPSNNNIHTNSIPSIIIQEFLLCCKL